MKPNLTKKQAREISKLVNKLMDLVEGKHPTVAVIAVNYLMAETVLLMAEDPADATSGAGDAAIGVIGYVKAAIAEGYYDDDKTEVAH